LKKKVNKRHTNKWTVRQIIQTDGVGGSIKLRWAVFYSVFEGSGGLKGGDLFGYFVPEFLWCRVLTYGRNSAKELIRELHLVGRRKERK